MCEASEVIVHHERRDTSAAREKKSLARHGAKVGSGDYERVTDALRRDFPMVKLGPEDVGTE